VDEEERRRLAVLRALQQEETAVREAEEGREARRREIAELHTSLSGARCVAFAL
jgi:hypothetical protein